MTSFKDVDFAQQIVATYPQRLAQCKPRPTVNSFNYYSHTRARACVCVRRLETETECTMLDRSGSASVACCPSWWPVDPAAGDSLSPSAYYWWTPVGPPHNHQSPSVRHRQTQLNIQQRVALTGRNTTGPPCSCKAIIRLQAAWRHRLACAGEAACRPAVQC